VNGPDVASVLGLTGSAEFVGLEADAGIRGGKKFVTEYRNPNTYLEIRGIGF